jgi:hypothetical protein
MEQKSHTEKLWEQEQEFLRNNQENVTVKVNKAEAFRKAYGYSRTMSKLMDKHGCKTVEEYREIRKAARKARKKTPKVKKVAPVVAQKQPQRKK